MAASPSSVLTLGYGSWGSVNLVPTLGYGVSVDDVFTPTETYCVCAAQPYTPGAERTDVYNAGAVQTQGDCC
jgi:hypothetical protein